MSKILLAGMGGFIGAALRYTAGVLAAKTGFVPGLVSATLIVNVLGCFLIGLLGGVAELRGAFSPELRAFLLAGILGGFTTYSAFGFETFALFREGDRGLAIWNVGLHLVLGLGAVWLGLVTARLVSPA